MRTVDMHQITNLPSLLKEALDGESFIIAQDGEPLFQVTAIEKEKPRPIRRTGFLKGEFSVPEDFDMMFRDEIIAMFEGEEK